MDNVIEASNVIVSFCCFVEDDKELFESVCRTCGTLIFLHSTNQIVMAFSLLLPSSMLNLADVAI